jgi:acylphosphatase
MSELSLQAVVTGKVQGVGFRAATVRQAGKLDLNGWVRNRDDGTVEVLFSGEPEAVEAMAAWLRKGPSRARVESVALAACAPQAIAGFVQL